MSAEQRSQRGPAIENLHDERRTFPPDPAFTAAANAHADLYAEAERDYVAFWERLGRERISWTKPFDTTLEWDLPFAKWFVGGELNVAYNCLDRHVEAGRGDKVAYHWIGEPGDTRTLTYSDLLREVGKAANALKELGVEKGDRVAIYMPMIPELPIAMLACARIGAPHTVVFGGFSAESLADRINDCDAKVLLTADAGYRRGKEVGLKGNADEALLSTPTIEAVIVVNRTGHGGDMVEHRDHWWHDIVDRQDEVCAPVPVDSEHMLYLLYTSGTTAKPKGILHTSAGYLLGAAFTHWAVFDIKPDDVYWCAADIGWVTGHSYIVYGPLANATTGILYEGAPDFPGPDRLWEIVARHKVTHLGLSPTVIRSLMAHGEAPVRAHDRSSLRVLGSTGEPWNPEPWWWYFREVGEGRCPVINYSGGTEVSGGIVGGNVLGPIKPASFSGPCIGTAADVVGEDGEPVRGQVGELVIRTPMPGMTRGFWGDRDRRDRDRYEEAYWSRWPGVWAHGDWASIDADGFWYIHGRSDDTLKVAGKRVGPAEVESAAVSHAAVLEAAAIGVPHEIKGEAIVVLCVLRPGEVEDEVLKASIARRVADELGKPLKPEVVEVVRALPKTRSGKVMRRVIRAAWLNLDPGDLSSLDDPASVEAIRAKSLSAR